MVLAAPPHIPHRDFVPWRFSVADRFRAPILSSWRPAEGTDAEHGIEGFRSPSWYNLTAALVRT
jgi:hypothetical protein